MNFKEYTKNINFDKILQSNENEKYYKTSALNFSDIEFLKIIWTMPIEKLEKLIELLIKDRQTAIALGRGRGRIRMFYKRDKLFFDSFLKWSKQILKWRLKGESPPPNLFT